MIIEGTFVRTGLSGAMITEMWSDVTTTGMKAGKVSTAAIGGSSPGLQR